MSCGPTFLYKPQNTAWGQIHKTMTFYSGKNNGADQYGYH